MPVGRDIRPYDPVVGHGTLDPRPFPILHPDPGRPLRRRVPSEWRADGRDLVTGPSVYVVELVSPVLAVRGIAVAVHVGDRPRDSGLLPHEAVDLRAVTRRVAALRRARVDREPVLLTHAGGGTAISAAVRAGAALFEIERHGVKARVSAVAPGDAEAVLADLAQRTCLVADGHHRLAAVAAHARHCPSGVTGGECALVSALIVDSDDTPLSLKPIHRVLQRRSPAVLRADDVVAALAGSRTIVGPGAGPARRGDAGPEAEHLVTVLDRAGRTDVLSPPAPAEGLWTTAHVVEAAITRLALPTVRRVPDPDAAVAAAARRGTVAVLLPPISRASILASLAAGHVMPVKATSFRPKLPPGIMLRPLPAHW